MIFNEINLSCFQKYFIHSFEKRDSLFHSFKKIFFQEWPKLKKILFDKKTEQELQELIEAMEAFPGQV